MFYSLHICLCYTLRYTLLMIYVHESTPSFLKRPLPTFKKFKLFAANNPLKVVASFFPLSRLKSSIPFFSLKIVTIFRRFWLKIVLHREGLRLLYALKVVSATFLLVCFLCLKESTTKTRKNVFYFTSKALFVLGIIKF